VSNSLKRSAVVSRLPLPKYQ